MKKAFTLAEVLITLAIIGVVAAIAIPSTISNYQQSEYKAGLRKAVSVLNQAITMNMAIDGESPYDNANLYGYLQRHMSIMKSGKLPYSGGFKGLNGTQYNWGHNWAFYTTDGMRFEFDDDCGADTTGKSLTCHHLKLHESGVMACTSQFGGENYGLNYGCGGCGSYGLAHNPNKTTKPPCAIMVDVNGDRKPQPVNANVQGNDTELNISKVPPPDSVRVNDIFVILITEDRAIPYGAIAQKAMYQAQVKK